jgi:hypothetical protein
MYGKMLFSDMESVKMPTSIGSEGQKRPGSIGGLYNGYDAI